MTPVPSSSRLFFAVIALAAMFVAILGLFAPAHLATLFSWAPLPPLHARFVGAIYAFGTVYMALCVVARRAAPTRWALLLITLWTGMLGLISLLNRGAFDGAQLPVQIWFASYTIYPLIGAALLAASRDRPRADEAPGVPLPPWARGFLWSQGALVSIVAACLFVAPALGARLWPWPVTPLLAQLYAGPLLAYGAGSLLCARQGTWEGAAALAPAMLVFTATALAASAMHRSLFAAGELPDLLWFAALGAATVGLALLNLGLLRRSSAAPG
jgi:hypothetical protein